MDTVIMTNNTLTGSDKQIAWATKIRANMMTTVVGAARAKCAEMLTRINAVVANDDATKSKIALAVAENQKVLEACDKIETITNASWWIDHRDDGMVETLNDVIRPGWRSGVTTPVFGSK